MPGADRCSMRGTVIRHCLWDLALRWPRQQDRTCKQGERAAIQIQITAARMLRSSPGEFSKWDRAETLTLLALGLPKLLFTPLPKLINFCTDVSSNRHEIVKQAESCWHRAAVKEERRNQQWDSVQCAQPEERQLQGLICMTLGRCEWICTGIKHVKMKGE